MPLDRHYENERVVVFQHPRPFWRFQLVAVPKKHIPTFLHLALDDPGTQSVLLDTLQAIRTTAQLHELKEGYVMVNGGRHQEVPQIHFHLISDPSRNGRWRDAVMPQPEEGAEVYRMGSALAFPYPEPFMRFHYVITSEKPVPGLCRLDFANPAHTTALLDILRAAQHIITNQTRKAYMLGTSLTAGDTDSQLVFHILSGSPGKPTQ